LLSSHVMPFALGVGTQPLPSQADVLWQFVGVQVYGLAAAGAGDADVVLGARHAVAARGAVGLVGEGARAVAVAAGALWQPSGAAQVYGVPPQTPLVQTSVLVQAAPSLQVVPSDLLAKLQVPSPLQVPALWHASGRPQP